MLPPSLSHLHTHAHSLNPLRAHSTRTPSSPPHRRRLSLFCPSLAHSLVNTYTDIAVLINLHSHRRQDILARAHTHTHTQSFPRLLGGILCVPPRSQLNLSSWKPPSLAPPAAASDGIGGSGAFFSISSVNVRVREREQARCMYVRVLARRSLPPSHGPLLGVC